MDTPKTKDSVRDHFIYLDGISIVKVDPSDDAKIIDSETDSMESTFFKDFLRLELIMVIV